MEVFNTNVINVLSGINSITDKIILRYPITVASSPAGDMLVHIDISKLDKEEFPDTGLYFLKNFLNTFKLFDENRKVSLSNNIINITGTNSSAQYITEKISLMKEYDIQPTIFEIARQVPSVSNFQLTTDDIKKLNSASGIFSDLNSVIFESKDGDMIISLGAQNKFNARSNEYCINKASTSNKEFKISIPVLNFKNIPVANYTVDIKYSDNKKVYRLVLTSNEVENLQIIMNTQN